MFNVLNNIMKKMTVVDIGLVKLSVFFFTLVIAKLFPSILNLSFPLLIILAFAFAARPIYKTLFQK